MLFVLCLIVVSSHTDQKSVLASVERELASKKKGESDVLKATQSDLKEARKQVNNVPNQLIGKKRVAHQGHQNQMELNKQRQTMTVVSHAAKLGTAAQTKAESLAQSQLQKANQFTIYSTNIAGMCGIGSGGMQMPVNGMGGMMNGMFGNGMMNGMGGNGGFNPYHGMANQMYSGGMRKFA